MRTVVWTALLVAPLWAQSRPSQSVDPAYRREVERQRAEQLKDLKENWIPLAGLFWLKPGANRFGTDSANQVVLPRGTAPANAGVFELSGESVTVKLNPGTKATINGKRITTAVLQPDTSGKPTILALGRLRMHVIKRQQRIGIRLKDLQNPALHKFRALSYFPINPVYRVEAKWVPERGNRTINVPDVLGDVVPAPVKGVAQFTLNGQQLTLAPTGGDPDKGLFFLFSDPTSKTETYPAGRFLDTGAVKDGTVTLDFNTAYNPPCAVTPYATCPIAPKENRLPMAIPAGEKYRRHGGH
ncbi:MAG: DUF1684 domain-containing protein [Terriglobales bacterium]